MKVLLISTSEKSGGGAIAAHRLMKALRANKVDAKMMVRDKQTDNKNVIQIGNKIPKFLERLAVLPRCGFNLSRLWLADIANVGIDISHTRAFYEADVIHLHWVCQGMISLDEMGRIMRSGKRVILTMHDEWPYVGVCHYRGNCKEQKCRHCPIMCGSLPYNIYRRKRQIYSRWHPTFVGCSQWITDEARRAMPSELVVHINNCIPSALFHPTDMKQARQDLSLPQDKRLLLFCSQKVTDERKGIAYLTEAIQELTLKGSAEALHLIIVGKNAEQIPLPQGIGVTYLGSVGEQMMPSIYNAADVFITPSLQDNLPNTIAEAMSCGTPCVGFNIGGIPEMIDHKENGYVARYRDANDLAEGIRFVLGHNLRQAAYEKAAKAYDEKSVVQQYISLYKQSDYSE